MERNDLLQKLPVGCLVLNYEGLIEFANDEICKIFQCSSKGLSGKLFTELFNEEKMDLDHLLKITTGDWVWVRDHQGQLKPIFLKINQVDSEFYLIVQDISHFFLPLVKDTGIEKKITYGELSSALNHDVANPLSIITTKAALFRRQLLKGPLSTENMVKYLDSMEAAAFKISGLLQKYRGHMRDEELEENRPTDISQLVKGILENIKVHQPEILKTIQIDFHKTGLIMAKEKHLKEAIKNILNNAYEAAIKKEGPWVKLNVDSDDKFVHLSISNSGERISPDSENNVLSAFWSTKKPGKGKNFGLTVAKKIVEAHEGKIVYKKDSPYTEFVISLPVYKV